MKRTSVLAVGLLALVVPGCPCNPTHPPGDIPDGGGLGLDGGPPGDVRGLVSASDGGPEVIPPCSVCSYALPGSNWEGHPEKTLHLQLITDTSQPYWPLTSMKLTLKDRNNAVVWQSGVLPPTIQNAGLTNDQTVTPNTDVRQSTTAWLEWMGANGPVAQQKITLYK